MKEYEPQVGDICEFTWRDHFEYRGALPEDKMVVKTWGKILHDEPEGYGIAMSEVQTDMSPQDIDKVGTNQWIWRESIEKVEVLKRE